jgi:hypothetical protein
MAKCLAFLPKNKGERQKNQNKIEVPAGQVIENNKNPSSNTDKTRQ